MVNWNISQNEIGLNRRGLLVWSLLIATVILIYLGSYTFIVEMDMVQMIEGYPEVIISGLGMSPEMFVDVNLYHGGLVMLFALLLASIYAMILAGGLVSRDSDLGTSDFLYARPVPRTTIMLSKVFSFLLMMVILWIIAYLVSVAVGLFWVAPGQFDLEGQFLAHLMGFLACLAAGGIAFAFSPLVDRVQGTTSLAIALGFAFFFLDGLAAMYEQLNFLRFFSIHYYADLTGAVAREPFVTGIIVLPAVFIAGVIIGTLLLNRKQFTA